ncbi:phage major capsid protein [Rothia halotolerans]|uniref:phage major capsid protein n=1 Tax=Rothia halotolerans TaxID=405770 RepID=UPI00101B5C3E|nr:phage major capsid protein [Rothia halotolerans]
MAYENSTTTNSPKGFAPDEVHFQPSEAVPEALLMLASTIVNTTLEGDAPAVRIPWIRDDRQVTLNPADNSSPVFTPEGKNLAVYQPPVAETVVSVRKLTQLSHISREMWDSGSNAQLLSQWSQRAVTRAADTAFLNGFPSTDPNYRLSGITETAGMVEGGNITTSLDPLADALAQVEANGAQPTHIIANPLAWGKLRNLKTAENSYASLLGAGTEDQDRKLFGIPVLTNASVPEEQMLILDRSAISSVAGPVKVAQSEHEQFSSDLIALRLIWHIGWAVQYPDRLATVTVGA